MFRVEAASVEEYLDFDPTRRAELVGFDELMAAQAPRLERHFHAGTPAGEPGMRFKMIGYGQFHYPASSGTLIAWPVVGLALQKNYISVYLSVSKGNAPVLASYASALNALRAGRNNFSFQQMSDLERPVLEALMAEVATIVRNDPGNPVRTRSGSSGQETR
jgi:hypothetical protein